MKKINYFSIAMVVAEMLLVGCTMPTGSANHYEMESVYDASLSTRSTPAIGVEAIQADRMLIWKGSMTLEVVDLTNATQQVKALAKATGGYVESTSFDDGHDSYYNNGSPSLMLVLRLPSDKLEDTLITVEGLGQIITKHLSSEDVTELFIDTQARLKTKKQLRDRLQVLLDKADDIKDVLAIERELNRLQADIDSMTARLKTMKGQIDLASLSLTLRPRPPERIEVAEIPGPVGYLWNGAQWCVRKLFVWREAGTVAVSENEGR